MAYERAVGPRRIWRLPAKLALAVACLGIVLTAAGGSALLLQFHLFRQVSASMSPTLKSGEVVVGETVSPAELHTGDVVVVDPTGWSFTGPALKRVIGTGGERVACCTSGWVTVNGRPLDEPYAPSANGGMPDYAVTVPAGRFFLLGDNRADSMDSRMFLGQEQGSLPASSIRMRVVWTADGGFQPGASKSLLVYVVLTGFGLLFLVLGAIALLVALIVAARRSPPLVPLWAPAGPQAPPAGPVGHDDTGSQTPTGAR